LPLERLPIKSNTSTFNRKEPMNNDLDLFKSFIIQSWNQFSKIEMIECRNQVVCWILIFRAIFFDKLRTSDEKPITFTDACPQSNSLWSSKIFPFTHSLLTHPSTPSHASSLKNLDLKRTKTYKIQTYAFYLFFILLN
jgi:hypothetical protein